MHVCPVLGVLCGRPCDGWHLELLALLGSGVHTPNLHQQPSAVALPNPHTALCSTEGGGCQEAKLLTLAHKLAAAEPPRLQYVPACIAVLPVRQLRAVAVSAPDWALVHTVSPSHIHSSAEVGTSPHASNWSQEQSPFGACHVSVIVTFGGLAAGQRVLKELCASLQLLLVDVA